MNNKRIIIVGGNAAGPSAAAKAKRVNPSAEVLMFEASPYISTGTCELPYVLSGLIENTEKIVFFDADKFKDEKGVDVHVNAFVQSIDRRNKEISVVYKSGNKKVFGYDKLILTTGAKVKKLSVLTEELLNIFNLKNVSDVNLIKDFILKHKVKNTIIIGGGYIGIEAAEALNKLNLNVTLIEKNEFPMNSSEREIQKLIFETITKNNVNFIGNVKKIRPIISDQLIKSINVDNRIIDCDLVIAATGFEPNNYLALSTGIKVGNFGGIKVDSKLKTNDASIYAAGDNIEVTNSITNKPMYLPLATLAHEYGHIAGANAAGENNSVRPVVKNIAVKIFENVYSSVGLSSKEAITEKINFDEVSEIVPNLVKVMPNSKKVFGKILYDKFSLRLLGASFYGGSEVTGYADLISALINQKSKVSALSEINYNYTPPNSPFINLLSVLGRKITRK